MAQQRTTQVAAPAVKPVNYTTTTSSYFQPEAAETPDASAAAAPAPEAAAEQPVYYYPAPAAAEEEEASPWSLSGWVNVGSTWNPANPRTKQNGINTFNYRSNEVQLNQAYLIAQRASNSDPDSFGIGGRVDMLYGTDWQFTYARGLEVKNNFDNKWNGDNYQHIGHPTASGGGFNDTFGSMYGLALPQAYAEFYSPIFGGVTTKVGHFYTLIGYEVVTAPDNFFITHNYSMQYGEPFTHTGFLSTLNVTENISYSGGVNRGWDAWEDGNNALSYLGMLTYTNPTFGGSLAIAYQGGPEGQEYPNSAPSGKAGWRNVTSIVFQQPITERLRYVFHSDIANDTQYATGTANGAEWYSATQYMFYDVTEKYSVGVRTGYFRDDFGVRISSNAANAAVGGAGLLNTSEGLAGNFWDLSFAQNYKFSDNLIARGECRYNWSDAKGTISGVAPYDDGRRGSQVVFTSDIILRF